MVGWLACGWLDSFGDGLAIANAKINAGGFNLKKNRWVFQLITFFIFYNKKNKENYIQFMLRGQHKEKTMI